MNWPSARSSSASWPQSTTKRAPESLARRGRSPCRAPRRSRRAGAGRMRSCADRPSAAARRCCASSGPSGTSSASTLGKVGSSASSLGLERRAARSSPCFTRSLSAVISASSSGDGFSPRARPLPDLARQAVAGRLVLLETRSRSRAGPRRAPGSPPRPAAVRGAPGRDRTRRAARGASGVDHRPPAHSRSSRRRRGILPGLLRRLLLRAALLEPAHQQDGDLVEQQHRHGEADLADHVGRREHGGGDEDQHDGIAPARGELIGADDADAPEQRQPDRQLEGDAEGEDQLHHQVEILADAGLELDRQLARARGRGLEAQEEVPGQGEDEVVDEGTAGEEQDRRGRQEGQQRLLLVAVQAGSDEQPELGRDEREGDEGPAPERDLDVGEEGFRQAGVDHPPVGDAHALVDARERPHQEGVDVGGERIAERESPAGSRSPNRPAGCAARPDDRAAASRARRCP